MAFSEKTDVTAITYHLVRTIILETLVLMDLEALLVMG